MYWLILLFPLMATIFSGLLGFYIGRQGACFITCFFGFLNCLLGIFIFYEVCICNALVTLDLWTWIDISSYNITFGLLFDSLTAMMLLIITFISFLVHVYSVDYMSHDPYQTRFMCYLSLFTFFMLVLVTADNFLQLFVGWEGVGLCSYLLINFWFTRILANKAALKAMLMNRIADVFFIFAIVIMMLYLRTTNYFIVFSTVHYLKAETIVFLGIPFSALSLITAFLFLGAIGKSAQLGFHTWLPDAMEGPTPVSSLLHAATMVTAGVFLLLRCSPLIQESANILALTALIGACTAVFFALVGIFQYDIKKVIAYSTCSQLGYMFLSCGLSNYGVAAFHLFNHAFFKALLFLGAGAVIHSYYDEQDMRRMGLSLNFLPFIYICFFIGSLAILGIPFYTGFYSKDLLLELTLVRYTIDSNYIYFLALLTALLTAIYSMRLLCMVFFSGAFSSTNGFRSFRLQEVSKFMHFSLVILCLASIMVGYLFSEIFSSIATPFWNNALYSASLITMEQEYISPWIKALPTLLSLLGCGLVFVFYELQGLYFFNLKLGFSKTVVQKLSAISIINFILTKISDFFYQAGYFNQIYNTFFLEFYKISYEIFNKSIDKGYLEILGPYGLYLFFRRLSLALKNIPSSLFFNVFIMFFFFCSLAFVLYITSGLLLLNIQALILPLLLFLIIYFNEN